MGFKKAGSGELPRTIDIRKEKEFEGYYMTSKVVESPKLENGKGIIHEFMTEDGEVVGIWGAGQLDYKLKEIYETCPGALTRVKHLGKTTFKKGKKTLPVHNFEVMYDPEQTRK